ncbi:MAG: hypothetical protein KF700_10615 [Hyphomonadaceae bacterium]|nr:hypothetical protein [Hyphomonadaceae bacterium]
MVPEASIVECGCGERYERREVKLPIKDIGVFECYGCGARLEIWSGRAVPTFRRLESSQTQSKRA